MEAEASYRACIQAANTTCEHFNQVKVKLCSRFGRCFLFMACHLLLQQFCHDDEDDDVDDDKLY